MGRGKVFRGIIVDRLNDRKTVTKTRYYSFWEDAQKQAEKLCNRKYGRDNQRYDIVVIY